MTIFRLPYFYINDADNVFTCNEYNKMNISQKKEYGKFEFTMIKGDHKGADEISIPLSCFEV